MRRIVLVILFVIAIAGLVLTPSVSKKFVSGSVINAVDPESQITLLIDTSKFEFAVEDSNFIISSNQGSLVTTSFEVEEFSQLDLLLANWTQVEENVYIYPDDCNYLELRIDSPRTKVSHYKCLTDVPNHLE